MKTITEGLTYTETVEVGAAQSAENYGNSGFPVLATPALVGLLEKAAISLVRPYVESDEGSVGTMVSIEHLAATPIGCKVDIDVRLVTVDRKRLVFELQARDAQGLIARCTHQRYVVQVPAFLDKLRARATSPKPKAEVADVGSARPDPKTDTDCDRK